MKTISLLLLTALAAAGLGCGYAAKATTPPAAGTAPAITTLSPASIAAGGAAFVLTVNGTNFASNAAGELERRRPNHNVRHRKPAHDDRAGRGHFNFRYGAGDGNQSRSCRGHLRGRHHSGNLLRDRTLP